MGIMGSMRAGKFSPSGAEGASTGILPKPIMPPKKTMAPKIGRTKAKPRPAQDEPVESY